VTRAMRIMLTAAIAALPASVAHAEPPIIP
jgi:hypothetical protein